MRKNNLKWVNYWFLTFIVILSWTYFHSCLLTLLQLYVFNRFFHPVIPRIWKYSILDYFSLRSKSREDSKYDYLRLSLVWQWFSLLTSSLPFPLNFPEILLKWNRRIIGWGRVRKREREKEKSFCEGRKWFVIQSWISLHKVLVKSHIFPINRENNWPFIFN